MSNVDITVYLKKEEAERLYRKLDTKITEADLSEEVKAKLGGGSTTVAAPQAQETETVLKQADIAKHASTMSDFTVNEAGTVTVDSVPEVETSRTAVFFPKGIKEMIFETDKPLHWIGVGADETMENMALLGIGSTHNYMSNLNLSTKALDFTDYTKESLDESHTYAAGGTYKIVINDDNVELYYQKDGEFTLWYRVVKKAARLSKGGTMKWFTPRFGAFVGATAADHTNNTILTEVKLIERTEPQMKETVRVLKQAEIVKNARTSNTFTVDESGTITSDTDFTSFNEANVPVLFFPEGVNEIIFEADDELTWIVAGADEALNEFALVGIGANKNCAHVSIAPYVFSNKVGYTRTALDETHQYGVGKTYKAVNSETSLVFYYKDGEEFKQWFRLIKEAIQMHDGTKMNWHTPRLGAAAGIADQDRTNRTLLTKVNVIERTPIGGSGVVDLSNYATKADLEKALGDDPSKKKLAILVVAGQSNAVGYDESPVDPIFSYGKHERVNELGLHENNLQVVPLGHCADNFQNMRKDNVTNPANPTLKGTKGIHLPLAKMLLDKIPSDYEIVVIPAAFGGSSFASGELGEYDSEGKKPRDLTQALKWGAGSAYLRTIIDRIKHLLDLNPANYYIGLVWCQGEFDVLANKQAEHGPLFDAMMTEFFNTFNNDPKYKNRVKGGEWGKKQVFIFETVNYWWTDPSVAAGTKVIWDYYREWHKEGYVEIPRETKSNTDPSTTSPSRPLSHFGQNAYADVIAPAVFAKMVEAKAV